MDTMQPMIEVMLEFNRHWEAMSVNQAALFLAIADADVKGKNYSISEAGDLVGMSLTSASRNVKLLNERRPSPDQPPLDWVTVGVSSERDHRERVVRLTAKGRAMYRKIGNIMGR